MHIRQSAIQNNAYHTVSYTEQCISVSYTEQCIRDSQLYRIMNTTQSAIQNNEYQATIHNNAYQTVSYTEECIPVS